MPKISPFLQMLLQRKSDLPEQGGYRGELQPQTPTISIRQRPPVSVPPPIVSGPMAPAIAIDKSTQVSPDTGKFPSLTINPRNDVNVPFGSTGEVFGSARPRRTQPRDLVADDAAALRELELKPRNKTKDILEGIGGTVASGLGINLSRILHPQGTDIQQAHRRLNTDIGVQQEQAKANEQKSVSGYRDTLAALDNAKMVRDASGPTDAKADAIKLSLGLHKQPFDPSNPADAALLAEAAKQGIIINPDTYGEKDTKTGETQHYVDETLPDGRKRRLQLNPKTGTFEPSRGPSGDIVIDVPKPDKVEPEVVDTSGDLGELEAGFRANAEAARVAADKAEADIKKYVQDRRNEVPQELRGTDKDYNPKTDANVESMSAEARRQRDLAKDQLERADSLAVKKVEAGGKAKTGKAKRQAGRVQPATHGFSISGWLRAHPGKTKVDAKADHDANYKDYPVVP